MTTHDLAVYAAIVGTVALVLVLWCLTHGRPAR